MSNKKIDVSLDTNLNPPVVVERYAPGKGHGFITWEKDRNSPESFVFDDIQYEPDGALSNKQKTDQKIMAVNNYPNKTGDHKYTIIVIGADGNEHCTTRNHDCASDHTISAPITGDKPVIRN